MTLAIPTPGPPDEGRVSAFSRAADVLGRRARNYRADPAQWAKDRGKAELWSKQVEIIESVRDNPLTAVQSAHSTGKSFVSSIITGWWLDTAPLGDAFVVTTAPTDKQVKAVLWREINRLHSRAGLAGRTNLSEWYIGKELVAFGRKPADQDPTAFNGIHALYVLLILDEADGIPKALWDAGSSIVSNKHARMLAIGNPDNPLSEFAKVCMPSSSWHKIKIPYTVTPNFTGEAVSERVADSLISVRWVEERKKTWGEASAIFQSKCMAEFPQEGTNGTVPYGWAQACRVLGFPTNVGIVEAGIDVGAGGDRTVIRVRHGNTAGEEFVFVDPDPMRTVGSLVQKIVEWGVTKVKIDSIGIGWGVYGRIRELSRKHNPTSADAVHDAEVIPVNFGESPSPGNETKYLNKRAEVYWEVGRENSRLRTWDLGVLDDDTIAELTASTYEIMDSKGKIKIEPKDKIIERLGASPDRAEALLLAFYSPSRTGSTIGGTQLANANLLGAARGGIGHAGTRGPLGFGR